MDISENLKQNLEYFKQELNVKQNFDIVYRDFKIMDKNACMFFIDGFVPDNSIGRLFEAFKQMNNTDFMANAEEFCARCIPFCDVSLESSSEIITTGILSGRVAVFVEGFNKAAMVDIRTYPQRSTAEPNKEQVMRGSKDGFVETLVLNAALLRRRIRTPDFCVEHFEVGKISKTDVALCYIKSRVNKKVLEKIRNKINSIETPALTMNQQSLADLLVKKRWLNPFPKFRYTERVDTASAQIMEGNIAILVDNAPSVMMLPNSLFDMMEEANDFYFPPITGTYLRLIRYLIAILTTIATPLWLLFLQNPQWIPEWLEFIKVSDPVNIPVIIQLLILEVAVDGLKLASLNTPSMMTTTLSMIGGIIVGDFAVKTGWFAPECMLYMAFVAIANFSLPSYELSYALKFMRIITLILTALFNVWGFAAGVIINLLSICFNKTATGYSYLYPLIPFNWKVLKRKFVRVQLEK